MFTNVMSIGLFMICLAVQSGTGLYQLVHQTKNGYVAGVIQKGFTQGNVLTFYGIPFAQPPVGALRFENPKPANNWSGVRQSTQLPPACMQSGVMYMQAHRQVLNKTSEDCLYLNVFIPINKINKMAVLLFIHGGSNVEGSGLMFDGGYLASHGQIVVITINYRLSVLGFLGAGAKFPEFRGNYGMMDQLMAMEWVKTNIANFKGDPNKVTVLGHSAGAMDVGMLLFSPLAKGLFRALICQSGPPTTPVAWKNVRADPQEEVRYVSHTLGCTNSTLREMKQCLQTLPAFTVIKDGLTCLKNHVYGCPVLVDGHFLPEEPYKLLKKQKFNTNKFVIGYTTSESDWNARWVSDLNQVAVVLSEHGNIPSTLNITDTFNFEYTDWTRPNDEESRRKSWSHIMSDAVFKADSVHTANLASDGGVKVYFYQWDHAPASDNNKALDPWMDVPHELDLFYLFGSPLSGHHLFNFTDLDNNMSKAMMETWSNYVKYGLLSPTVDLAQSRGQTYDSTKKTYLRFHARNGQPEVTVENNPRPRQVYFWKTYLPRLIKQLERKTAPPT